MTQFNKSTCRNLNEVYIDIRDVIKNVNMVQIFKYHPPYFSPKNKSYNKYVYPNCCSKVSPQVSKVFKNQQPNDNKANQSYNNNTAMINNPFIRNPDNILFGYNNNNINNNKYACPLGTKKATNVHLEQFILKENKVLLPTIIDNCNSINNNDIKDNSAHNTNDLLLCNNNNSPSIISNDFEKINTFQPLPVKLGVIDDISLHKNAIENIKLLIEDYNIKHKTNLDNLRSKLNEYHTTWQDKNLNLEQILSHYKTSKEEENITLFNDLHDLKKKINHQEIECHNNLTYFIKDRYEHDYKVLNEQYELQTHFIKDINTQINEEKIKSNEIRERMSFYEDTLNNIKLKIENMDIKCESQEKMLNIIHSHNNPLINEINHENLNLDDVRVTSEQIRDMKIYIETEINALKILYQDQYSKMESLQRIKDDIHKKTIDDFLTSTLSSIKKNIDSGLHVLNEKSNEYNEQVDEIRNKINTQAEKLNNVEIWQMEAIKNINQLMNSNNHDKGEKALIDNLITTTINNTKNDITDNFILLLNNNNIELNKSLDRVSKETNNKMDVIFTEINTLKNINPMDKFNTEITLLLDEKIKKISYDYEKSLLCQENHLQDLFKEEMLKLTSFNQNILNHSDKGYLTTSLSSNELMNPLPTSLSSHESMKSAQNDKVARNITTGYDTYNLRFLNVKNSPWFINKTKNGVEMTVKDRIDDINTDQVLNQDDDDDYNDADDDYNDADNDSESDYICTNIINCNINLMDYNLKGILVNNNGSDDSEDSDNESQKEKNPNNINLKINYNVSKDSSNDNNDDDDDIDADEYDYGKSVININLALPHSLFIPQATLA